MEPGTTLPSAGTTRSRAGARRVHGRLASLDRRFEFGAQKAVELRKRRWCLHDWQGAVREDVDRPVARPHRGASAVREPTNPFSRFETSRGARPAPLHRALAHTGAAPRATP